MIKIQRNSVIALGANLSFDQTPPILTLRHAVRELSRKGMVVTAESRFYATPCFPPGAGPDYVNAAIAINANLSPVDLLVVLHEVEEMFGRRREQRWGMRTLDLDLIFYGDNVLPTIEEFEAWCNLPSEVQAKTAPTELILPHPRLQDRAFVLVPMADVAPDWRHPVLGKTVVEMLADLPPKEVAEVKPLLL
ncbi:2-amino-4-hydroxy-6-hydroxymethyldihydropteridine diphosphokinase [Ruegeria sp. WL0004]|uniref:2-amino-4-hydroxy-6-hydroxymethyldihydropteridine pyrophosphokinase n=1 Tax=Ruegeria marisflavi TaxID=2984152 RepID=A0ABT2WXC8_9RHOB|nr:2-amino-4-hydroxy-6-hydroxymethyldihydropteridine diphosphokinase [Ruegeria sp. WL0004]MCU9838633.1 2-amino-4-hydroxy-6-hydroxymethyldihydropteridine diphosphokinase [Ruegeria sp. WL0004]